MKIWEMPVAVLLWTQEGCPACEEYLPKFRTVALEYAKCLPVIIVDVNAFPRAADVFRVQSTPTTMITRFGKRGFAGFIDGDGSEDRIRTLFGAAASGLDCQI